jgi:hypothetical protein
MLRRRGDCLGNQFDIWVGGYPRSANSFATAMLKLSNPGLQVATHWHIPAFIINAVRSKRPGILLVRQPKDAVTSWTIFWEGRWSIEEAIDYYVDFHEALLDCRDQLFIASFDEATRDFESVVKRFNRTFQTNYTFCANAVTGTSQTCVSYLENWFRCPDGSINECKVPRPSARRETMKTKLVQELTASPGLIGKLSAAEELYQEFFQTAEEGCSCVCAPTASLELSKF